MKSFSKIIAVLLVMVMAMTMLPISAFAASAATTSATSTDAVVKRLGGADRYETSCIIADEGFDTAENVVLASGQTYADALSGAPLAYALNAPILLSDKNSINQSVLSEMKALGAKKVYILGGDSAIAPAVAQTLESNGLGVERIAGATRFETSVRIAEKLDTLGSNSSNEIFIASGVNYPDALSAASIAALKRSPILYAPKSGELDDVTGAYIKKAGASRANVLGGAAAVGEKVDGALRNLGVDNIERYGGSDRYETSLIVSKSFDGVFASKDVSLATGKNFPDALPGGVFGAKKSIPVLLTNNETIDSALKSYIQSKDSDIIYVFGGKNAVSDAIANGYLPKKTVSTSSTTQSTSSTTPSTSSTTPSTTSMTPSTTSTTRNTTSTTRSTTSTTRSTTSTTQSTTSTTRSTTSTTRSTTSTTRSTTSTTRSTTSTTQSTTSTTKPTAQSFTVTFDANGTGTANLPSAQVVEQGKCAAKPSDPIRDGYTFGGWYTETECINTFDFAMKINKNTVLYAKWIKSSADDIATTVEDSILDTAYNRLRIGYAQGNNSSCVTKDVTLVSAIDVDNDSNDDVAVSWDSNNDSVIDSNGKIVQPQTNTALSLTATLTYGEKSKSKSFELKVIRDSKATADDILDHSSADELAPYNGGVAPEIIYDPDNTSEIDYIDGAYTDMDIQSAEDAIISLYSVRSILGIDDPQEEFTPLASNISEDGNTYALQQMYKGLPVIGRNLTVATTKEHGADLIRSDYLSGINISVEPGITSEAAVAAVTAYYGEGVESAEALQLAVYSIGEYETNPKLVYVVWAYGEKDGEAFDDLVYVDENSGAILMADTNIITANYTGTGDTELGSESDPSDDVSFPVDMFRDFVSYEKQAFYFLEDSGRGIKVYNGSKSNSCMSEITKFSDKTAVSAYTNTIKVYDWYDNLGHKSIDGSGDIGVDIVVHDSTRVNNAAFLWNSKFNFTDTSLLNSFLYGSDLSINFGDNSADQAFPCSTAGCLDVVAHEYTHAVNLFIGNSCTYSNESGAICEAYSDIMGTLCDGAKNNWQFGSARHTSRNIADPKSTDCPAIYGASIDGSWWDWPTENLSDDEVSKTPAHKNSTVISHAAYLMNQRGISIEDLTRIWYRSMFIGYGQSSRFVDVRRKVILAAEALGYSNDYIKIIEKAFDDVNVCETSITVTAHIVDESGNSISGASVDLIFDPDHSESTVYGGVTDTNGNAMMYDLLGSRYSNVYRGSYRVVVNCENYEDYESEVSVVGDKDVLLEIELMSSGSGKVFDETTNFPIADVIVTVFSGEEKKQSTQTNSDGRYLLVLEDGNYRLTYTKNGYVSQTMSINVVNGIGVCNEVYLTATSELYKNGDGTAEKPYQISTPVQLLYIYTKMNAHFELMNNIDLSTFNNGIWDGIGCEESPFSGSFDGKEYTISNVDFDSMRHGLFNCVSGAEISNVTVSVVPNGISISRHPNAKDSYLGILVGKNMTNAEKGTTISNCHISGDINVSMSYASTGEITSIGGVVGTEEALRERDIGDRQYDYILDLGHNSELKLTDCSYTGNISVSIGEIETRCFNLVGGAVGICYNLNGTNVICEGDISVSSTQYKNGHYIGGLVGYSAYLTANSCKYAGKVTGDPAQYIGGMSGYAWESSISKATITAEIVGNNNYDGFYGGIIGDCYIISLSESSVKCTLDAAGANNWYTYTSYAGGVCGRLGTSRDSVISNCHIECSITNSSAASGKTISGGIAGEGEGSVTITSSSVKSSLTPIYGWAASGGLLGVLDSRGSLSASNITINCAIDESLSRTESQASGLIVGEANRKDQISLSGNNTITGNKEYYGEIFYDE